MNFGKFKYQKKKKSQQSKKNQTTITVKEIQFRPNTDVHDFEFKIKHLERFIKEGNKAKVAVKFKGREMMHFDLGMNMMNRVIEKLLPIADLEQRPEKEGRNIIAILTPKKISSTTTQPTNG